MEIKNIYFVQPCIVEFVDKDNLSERRLVYFDLNRQAIINPYIDGKKIELLTDSENLIVVAKKIKEIIKQNQQFIEEDEDILANETILNNVSSQFKEKVLNEFGKIEL